MTILRYYPLSANIFHLILYHTFHFTVHSYRHHYYYYYYFKSTQIHLSSRKSKIIFDPPSYILLSHAKPLSHGKRFVRIFLSFPCIEKERNIQIDLRKRSREISRKKHARRTTLIRHDAPPVLPLTHAVSSPIFSLDLRRFEARSCRK